MLRKPASCGALIQREMLPRLFNLESVLFPEVSRCVYDDLGEHLCFRNNPHYLRLVDVLEEGDEDTKPQQLCLESDQAMALTAKTVRRFYETQQQHPPGPNVRDALQKVARLSTEIHLLTQFAFDHPVAPMFRLEPQNLIGLAHNASAHNPQVIVDVPYNNNRMLSPILPRVHAGFVVTELIRNAVQASHPHHKIQVATSNVDEAVAFSVTNLSREPFRAEEVCYGRANPDRLGSTGVGVPLVEAVCDIFGKGLHVRSLPDEQGLFRTVATALFI